MRSRVTVFTNMILRIHIPTIRKKSMTAHIARTTTARIGMIAKTRTTAAVISVIVLAVVVSARGEPQADDRAKRRAAFAWATRQQQMALSAVFPPATRDDPLPVCRVVTIRPSSVSADRRE